MKPIAVFYHTRLSGGDPHIDFDHAFGIMEEQMSALKSSGLEEAARQIYIGVNGTDLDKVAAAELSPKKSHFLLHPEAYRGELPTLYFLQNWAKNHIDWHVFYHHIKGAIHKGEGMYANWRHCMQRNLVLNWERCVRDMNQCDSVGCHWMTPEKYPPYVKSPFWGGNFWWANSSFLLSLPPLRQTAETREHFYEAESWIGTGPRRPMVVDYHDAWPGAPCS